jgi:hypothetical protein
MMGFLSFIRGLASMPSMEAVLNALWPWMTCKRTTQIGMHRERVEVDVDMDAEVGFLFFVPFSLG